MTKCATSIAALVVAFATMAFAAQTGAQPRGEEPNAHPMAKHPHIKAVLGDNLAKDHLPVTNKLAESYTFTLNSFNITDTRSVHNDTDVVSIAVAVGNNPPITLPAKSMGDVNNGTHAVNLSIPNVSVAAAQKVAFSYSIVNAGHDKDSIEKALTPVAGNAANQAVDKAVEATAAYFGIDPATAKVIGTKAGGWLGPKIANIIFADCDGSVAAGDHVFTGAALARLTNGGSPVSGTDDNKGTDSNWGCGGNSRYYVTWTVTGSAQNSTVSSRGPAGGQRGVEVGRHHLQN